MSILDVKYYPNIIPSAVCIFKLVLKFPLNIPQKPNMLVIKEYL